MAQTLTISSAQLVADARKQIREIDASEAIGLLDKEDVVIVDLRDVRERERSGYIPGSFHCPRGMAEFWVDPGSPYYKEVFSQDASFVFHCASGWRSAITVLALQEMGMESVAHITHGFTSWKDADGPIEYKNSKKE